MSEELQEIITTSFGGTHNAYHVEVRSGVKHPVTMKGVAYGEQWAVYDHQESCLPPSAIYAHDAYHGLLRYEAAMAIAWAVMAYSQSFIEPKAFGIQVRVVESKVTYDYKAVRVKEFPNIPWRGGGNEQP